MAFSAPMAVACRMTFWNHYRSKKADAKFACAGNIEHATITTRRDAFLKENKG